MKNLFLIGLFLFIINTAFTQSWNELYAKGVTYWEQEDYINAISYFDQSVSDLVKTEGKDGVNCSVPSSKQELKQY